jgi:hypothetical protein
MINALIALKSFDKLFRYIGVNPNEKKIAVLILFVVKFKVEILMDQIVNHRIFCLQKHLDIG